MSSKQVYKWLAEAGLEKYYKTFEEQKISPQVFLGLDVHDYSSLGIHYLPDKQKLFRQVQQLRRSLGYSSQTSISPSTKAESTPVASVGGDMDIGEISPPRNVGTPGGGAFFFSWDDDYSPVHQPGDIASRGAIPIHHREPQEQKHAPQSMAVTMKPPAPKSITGGVRDSGIGIETPQGTLVPSDYELEQTIDQRIRVVVRKRPLNPKEKLRKERDICTCESWNQVSIHEPKVKVDLTKFTEVHSYHFDQVFSEKAHNQEVYYYTARPLVKNIFAGKKATCFCYGQTGAGKTYTMMEKNTGIYVLAAADIFKELEKPEHRELDLSAHVSFFEIYGGKLFDLLNSRKRLWAREDGTGNVCISGLDERPIRNTKELLSHINDGLTSRSVGATGVNADSSRSHAILQIVLRDVDDEIYGKISFIDLAGSERAADTMNTDRRTRMEGAEINKSLLALKECIRALDRGSKHLPFRGSKLTMVLKDSFIGDARTVMIANLSPNDKAAENTLNTLRYAYRVKELGTKPGEKIRKYPVVPLAENECATGRGIGGKVLKRRKKKDSGSGESEKRRESRGSRSSIPNGNSNKVVPPAAAKKLAARKPRPGQRDTRKREKETEEGMRERIEAEVRAKVEAEYLQKMEKDASPIHPPIQSSQASSIPQPSFSGKPSHSRSASSSSSEPEAIYASVDIDEEGLDEGDELEKTHQDVAATLLTEEDDIVFTHRQEVDAMVNLVREEVSLLCEVEKGEVETDAWVTKLENILARKTTIISELQEKLAAFKHKLLLEEQLCRSIEQHKSGTIE
ncbi:Kinesin-13 [Aduncisulcus paluster]|uniref:Kinesin-like protein n=1 Tax=Aduncisulcus paluster TaxID=2918883 RepID=A0ABQ5K673_9EUKA|nr:Kinesin-13 [Aduncisulcus paluster]